MLTVKRYPAYWEAGTLTVGVAGVGTVVDQGTVADHGESGDAAYALTQRAATFMV